MQELDLGDDVQLKVKFKGKEYILREPSVDEVEFLRGVEGDKMDVPAFLARLGMPLDVVKGMGLSKAKALVEGLLDLVTKKK
jgi:hypothetical protein